MKTWKRILRDGAISGSIASFLSTVMLAACGKQETDSAAAPTNAISHWIWGERAAHHNELDKHHTLPGYLIHHGASTLWAVVYEKWFGSHAEANELVRAATGAATVAALACFVDYNLTPKRLRPGYEKRLSKPSLFLVYAATGAGFMIRGCLQRRKATRHLLP